MHTMRYIVLMLLLVPLMVLSQSVNVIPRPQEIISGQGFFEIDRTSRKQYREKKDTVKWHRYAETPAYMLRAQVSDLYKSVINVAGKVNDPRLGESGYHLRITGDSITVLANTAMGVHMAFVTLKQVYENADIDSTASIIPHRLIPICDITDYPAYGYRGMHLDVCRHFFSKAFIKKYIDLLALYKINTFHWHLTDDQGWRIEIRKYPRLTEVGAWRTEKDGSRYGGYYTQKDISEIISYASERFITIIPEIEMPGHSSAALAAYPEFGCTGNHLTVPNTWGIKKDIYAPTDSTFKFFEDVMDEVCELFPSKYIHIGGDEAPKVQWKSSAIAQAVMKQKNLKNEEELQHYFMHRVESYLNKKGRTAIGWGEVVKGGLSDSMVVMSWLDKSAGIKAAKHGNDVIMAPRGYCYFDYPQAGDKLKAIWMLPLPLTKVYAFDPMPAGLSAAAAKHVLGGEATLWTEYVTTEEEVLHQLMPRLVALSEALWTGKVRKDYKDFVKRLNTINVK
ncbi:MAG: beta-N-acetylhexosaminidase [Bacteroidetes bacterium]|nr:beta-N-acetylhexosaminidase [Bacteroidota bacterium]